MNHEESSVREVLSPYRGKGVAHVLANSLYMPQAFRQGSLNLSISKVTLAGFGFGANTDSTSPLHHEDHNLLYAVFIND